MRAVDTLARIQPKRVLFAVAFSCMACAAPCAARIVKHNGAKLFV